MLGSRENTGIVCPFNPTRELGCTPGQPDLQGRVGMEGKPCLEIYHQISLLGSA